MLSASEFVLVQGLRDTRATLDGWNRDPWPVLGRWLAASAATAACLLIAVWVVARLSPADPTPLRQEPPTLTAASSLFARNLLVLALHALACVAGFIAGSSLPQLAAERRGISRVLHERAGPLAIAFVVGATAFSLITQAYVLGEGTATVAAQRHISPALLIVGLLPHALPELIALFLPLAAWVLASRHGEWEELLAATFATVSIALPMLALSALVEVYVSPRLISALAG